MNFQNESTVVFTFPFSLDQLKMKDPTQNGIPRQPESKAFAVDE
jgi:hypothetical protein